MEIARTEPLRDGYGRPIILGVPDEHRCSSGRCGFRAEYPDHGHYTRTTTIAKVLDDTYNVERWKQRHLVHGLTKRHDLLDQAASIPIDSADSMVKKSFHSIIDEALSVGGASVAASRGTALHGASERWDKDGITVPIYEPAMAAQLEQYKAYTAGWTMLGREVFAVHDKAAVAGTADMVCVIPGLTPPGMCTVADLKTGSSMDFGHLGFASQVAAYASMLRYDLTTGQRSPLAGLPVDQAAGYILWLPAMGTEIGLWRLDLEYGREVLRASVQARRLRSHKAGMVRVA